MKWKDAIQQYPNKWLLIKAIKAKSENGQRIIEDLGIINAFESGSEALKEYTKRHKLNKSEEMYVYHTSKNTLDIAERVWMGVRKND
jgi:hypothetical protein